MNQAIRIVGNKQTERKVRTQEKEEESLDLRVLKWNVFSLADTISVAGQFHLHSYVHSSSLRMQSIKAAAESPESKTILQDPVECNC